MGRHKKRRSIKLYDRVSDLMLDNLSRVYGVDRASVLEVLVRLMHKIHFGGRMYPELNMDFNGYSDLLLALITEEASHGGTTIGKVHERIKAEIASPCVVQAQKWCETRDIKIDTLSSEYWSKMLTYGSGLTRDGRKVGRNE